MLILKAIRVVCFDRLLEVLILKVVGGLGENRTDPYDIWRAELEKGAKAPFGRGRLLAGLSGPLPPVWKSGASTVSWIPCEEKSKHGDRQEIETDVGEEQRRRGEENCGRKGGDQGGVL